MADRPPENARGRRMVAEQLVSHGVSDPRVLAVMADLPREEFVPPSARGLAYGDHPLAIGAGQTISQPLVVALITQAVAPAAEDRVLEVGAGSGYQAAVLARLCRSVVAVELNAELAAACAATLARLGIANVSVHQADGRLGWEPQAPYDAIVVSAAAGRVPPALLDQLADGGRLVIPVETGRPDVQDLLLFHKRAGGGLESTALFPVRFVPLVEGGRQPGG